MILNKEVISPKVQQNFVPLLEEVGEDFVARVHKKIKRTGQNKWTTDLSQELFKYALECKADFYLSVSKYYRFYSPCRSVPLLLVSHIVCVCFCPTQR